MDPPNGGGIRNLLNILPINQILSPLGETGKMVNIPLYYMTTIRIHFITPEIPLRDTFSKKPHLFLFF
jgi:hypothetical protein